MQPSNRLIIRPRNPKTHAKHRREVLWQITIPLLVVLLLLLGLVGLVIWSSVQADPEVSRWANVSLVWLVVPVIILSFIFLLLLSAITFGVIKLIQVLPGYARLADRYGGDHLRPERLAAEHPNEVRPVRYLFAVGPHGVVEPGRGDGFWH